MLRRVQQLRHAGGGSVGKNGLVEALERVIIHLRGFYIGLADVEVVYLDSAADGGIRLTVELTHGRKAAFFHFG